MTIAVSASPGSPSVAAAVVESSEIASADESSTS
jgi:hypothetical protein